MDSFVISVIGLSHSHIYGMCENMLRSGAVLKSVYDEDKDKCMFFLKKFPFVKIVSSEEEILSDPEVKLVLSADITCKRGPLGVRVMESGKDYFTDKGPFTSLEQLQKAKETVERTKQKYMVFYSERLQNESSVYAEKLIKQGSIGRVLQVIGLGPHRLSPDSREDWFFRKKYYGGIITDIGSHQIEQFLYFTGAKDATVLSSRTENFHNPQYPELEDFGEVNLIGDNGASGYIRVDWLTPDGLSVWGDGRVTILGTDGYIELRKYVNIAEPLSSQNPKANHVFLVNHEGEQYINATGKTGYPFFDALIYDCINRTETALSQEHIFCSSRICLLAQQIADKRKEKDNI